MKNILKLIPVLVLAVAICSGCIKKTTTTGTANSSASQHNQDVQNTKSESDNSNTDINSALTGTGGFGKNSATEAISICGATIDSTHQQDSPNPYIIITYDGHTVCPAPNRIKSGTVKVELVSGTSWVNAGAQVQVTYTNYEVKFLTLNNAFIVFNGTKMLTDVSGYNLLAIYTGQPVQIKERTYGMTVGFENDSTSSWNDARLTSWAYTAATGNITATVNGDTTINGQVTDSWGQTRWGTNFVTTMQSPWVSGTLCGWWAPISGEYTSTTNFNVSATFGVNSSGGVVSSGCPGYFSLSWTIDASNASGTVVLPYF